MQTETKTKTKKKTNKKKNFDELLDDFTHPKTLQKRKIKQEAKQKKLETQREQKNADDYFNEIPDEKQLMMWKNHINYIPSLDVLNKLFDESSIEIIDYKRLDCIDEMFGVLDFIACAKHIQCWLEIQMAIIGWKNNLTMYNPIAVSNSTSDLLKTTLECFRMMIKQMILVIKSQTK